MILSHCRYYPVLVSYLYCTCIILLSPFHSILYPTCTPEVFPCRENRPPPKRFSIHLILFYLVLFTFSFAVELYSTIHHLLSVIFKLLSFYSRAVIESISNRLRANIEPTTRDKLSLGPFHSRFRAGNMFFILLLDFLCSLCQALSSIFLSLTYIQKR